MEVGHIGVYVFLFLALYFEVFLMISFLEKRPGLKTAARPKIYPFVSMIVPCFNEEKTLAGTVESLLALDYPKDKLEVLIVNDGSTDSTLDVAKRFEGHSQVRVFSKQNGGKYTALNIGIDEAKGELIGCLDADSFVTEDALTETVKKFEESPTSMAVVPAMRVHHPKNLLELMQAVEYTFGIFYKKMFGNLAAISVLPGPFSIYRREVFERIGKFRHAHNTEDMEMAFRMHEAGLLIENAHTATVYTKVPKNVRALLKQRTRWSQGFLQNSQDYRHMYFNRRFGYFGILVLPFLLSMFVGALYMWSYLIVRGAYTLYDRTTTYFGAGVPLHVPAFHFDWFYFDTGMMTFLAAVMLAMTLISILLGRRIAQAQSEFGLGALVSYFMLYGFLAPLWLARAAWGAVRARDAIWR